MIIVALAFVDFLGCSAQFYPLYMPRRLWNTICDYYHYVTWMYLMNEIFGKTWKSLTAFSNNTWKSFSIQVESSYNHWLLSRLMKCLWMTYSLFFGFFPSNLNHTSWHVHKYSNSVNIHKHTFRVFPVNVKYPKVNSFSSAVCRLLKGFKYWLVHKK